MQDTLITITIVTFGFLLVANVFFRIKTFRTFKKLAEQGVMFSKEHVLSKELLEREIISKHPDKKELILSHVNSMKLSMRISMLCMVVLTICGAVLMYYRK
ncbi:MULTISPECIES: hypothetical protein [unclassified Aureispira]|uniref:hypothetical protein n=1 Tax=unclassified Aureispira TaxID=2649989 RepID=UPI0006966482|nr:MULTISPECIES: hypothetical protein [unclassified Aureispira]WMX15966.1 hypothetical protein QP953_06265 [Aureispira sp. CCB-E]